MSMSMTAANRWWRRVSASMKDKRSLCIARSRTIGITTASPPWRSDIEAAVIRATSHDDRFLDYKNIEKVFRWARASPSIAEVLMRCISRRATRTKSWPVALKSLLLAHGLLLLPSTPQTPYLVGRLPFDLSDFTDKSPACYGFSAFVRAYFRFLDHRSILVGNIERDIDELILIESQQTLLDSLIQIKPYANGMNTSLILEAMDCAVIEIFDVYSAICSGMSRFLMESTDEMNGDDDEEQKKRGIRVLRKAAEQNKTLTEHFKVCRALGVLNAELPAVEIISDEDISQLEKFVLAGDCRGISGNILTFSNAGEGVQKETKTLEQLMREKRVRAEWKNKRFSGKKLGIEKEGNNLSSTKLGVEWEATKTGTIVTENWVVFEEESQAHIVNSEYFGNNSFIKLSHDPMSAQIGAAQSGSKNLIELI